MPSRWGNISGPAGRNARFSETWFGRLGAIGILGRYATNQSAHGLSMLRRFASVAVASGNIYESYTMAGAVGGCVANFPTTSHNARKYAHTYTHTFCPRVPMCYSSSPACPNTQQ